MTAYFIGIASLLLLAVQAEPIVRVPDQYVFNLPNKSNSETIPLGQLWRFAMEGTGVVEDVLNLIREHDLDLWQIGHSNIDIYTPGPESLPESLLSLPHSLVANISAPESKRRASFAEWDLSSLQNTTFHEEYHPLFEIDTFIWEIQRLHPDLVTVKTIGLSGMGREMLSLVISKDEEGEFNSKKHFTGDQKLSFVILGAQHAREWVATATSLYLAHALVSDPSEPHSLSHLLDIFNFYIVPVPNPDGYEYTWETDRFWYKTRQQMTSKSTQCMGLDMNRNWGYKWKAEPELHSKKSKKKTRHTVDPCSHWYPGHRPFEAPEVNNIANLVITISNLVGFLDLRSYGQMLSSPYSYSCSAVPRDAEDQLEAGLGAAQAMSHVHGTSVTTGSLCSQLYGAPGNVVDWMYKKAGIKYSYAVHLRDTGTYGFTLPPRWIRPVGEETSEMLKYLTGFIAKKMNRDV